MSLKNIYIPRDEVSIGENADGVDQVLKVRGLSLQDVSAIIAQHGQDCESLFGMIALAVEDKMSEGGLSGESEVVQAVLGQALVALPKLVGTIIAVAADEPDHAENVALLPALVQVNILVAVANLTFKSEEDLLKLTTAIQGLMAKVQKESKTLPA